MYCLPITAQEYIPMLQEGNVWSVDVYDDIWEPPVGTPCCNTNTYQISIVDTVILNDLEYKRIGVDGWTTVNCLLREENGIVYMLMEDGITERTLFDYTLEVGDTFDVFESAYAFYPICLEMGGEPYDHFLTVSEINYEQIAGQNRKVISFNEGNGTSQFQWIEGIGNITGFSLMWEIWDITGGSLLVCFTENSQTTFFNGATSCNNTTLSIANFEKEFITLYPNPVYGVSSISLPKISNSYHIKIFNLQGKLVQENNQVSGNFKINRADYNTGLYFYQVFNEGVLIKTDKFLVK